METRTNVKLVGLISSFIAMIMTIIFAFALVLGFWYPVISGIISFIVCFILALAFLIMIICIDTITPEYKQLWSRIGIAFASIYVVFITLTYYTQLALIFNPPSVSSDILNLLDYQEPNSWIFKINMLGYGFMTLSTLFTAFVFGKSIMEKWLKRIFIFHGIFFVPTIIFPLLPLKTSVEESALFGSLALILWCVIFIPLAGFVTRYFRVEIIKNNN